MGVAENSGPSPIICIICALFLSPVILRLPPQPWDVEVPFIR
jgi:hypothetical protein